MVSQTEKRSLAREALLDAAEKLFSEKGYEAVGTRELADAAGVNLGAIQYYFGSKAELFIQTVHRIMERGSEEHRSIITEPPVRNKDEAALRLCQFVRTFLCYLLRPSGPQACRIMYREALSERSPEVFEALLSSVIVKFIGPVDQLLLSVVRQFRPAGDALSNGLYVQSFIGQCSFYVTHGPFAARLRGVDFAASPYFEQAGRHISTFSLRGLGCDEAVIARVTSEVFGEEPANTAAYINFSGNVQNDLQLKA